MNEHEVGTVIDELANGDHDGDVVSTVADAGPAAKAAITNTTYVGTVTSLYGYKGRKSVEVTFSGGATRTLVPRTTDELAFYQSLPWKMQVEVKLDEEGRPYILPPKRRRVLASEVLRDVMNRLDIFEAYRDEVQSRGLEVPVEQLVTMTNGTIISTVRNDIFDLEDDLVYDEDGDVVLERG